MTEFISFGCACGHLYISDPYYDKQDCKKKNLFTLGTVYNVKPGTYNGYITMDEIYPDRVQYLTAVHQDYKNWNDLKWEDTFITLGVDGGRMGISDYDRYPNPTKSPGIKKFENDIFKNETIFFPLKYYEEVIGCVSKSGFGDGLYGVYKTMDLEQIIGIRVDFINEKQRKQWQRLIGENE